MKTTDHDLPPQMVDQSELPSCVGMKDGRGCFHCGNQVFPLNRIYFLTINFNSTLSSVHIDTCVQYVFEEFVFYESLFPFMF